MSADFLPYINLRPLDISPAQIYLDSIEVARTVFPNFDLRPGTIEDAMFQAFAYMSSLNIGAINRLPDSLMLGVGKMLGTPYLDGTNATMDVTFTANSNDGATIPAGTLVSYTPQSDTGELNASYVFETNELHTIASNSPGSALPTGTVNCTSRILGILPVIPTGTNLSLLSFSQELYSAVSAGNFVQGQDAETIDEFLIRTVGNLSSMSSALVTADQLKNYILTSYPTIAKRCRVYDLTDPSGNLLLSDAEVAGKVAIFVYGPGRNLTQTEITSIETDIANKSVAGLELGVLNPVLLNFKITATVSYYSNFDTESVSSLLKETLLNSFSPVSYQSSEEKLRYNSVLRAIHALPSIYSVDSLTISKTDSSTITGAVKSGNNVTYTSANTFSVGDLVTVTGITPSSLNSTQRAITARTATSFTVENASASGTYSSGGSAAVTSPNWGATSGNDILYQYKGSLLNLQSEKIVLTLNSIEV